MEWRGMRRPSVSFFSFLHRHYIAAMLSHTFYLSLFLSRLPKRRKTRRCRGSIVLSAAWEEVPHIWPNKFPSFHTLGRSFFLRFVFVSPSQRGARYAARAARRAHRRFKVATVLAGKLFDRLPLNHSSRTPALLSSIPPPPVAGSTTPRLFVSLFFPRSPPR